jgi:thiol:disulfide interchange protein
MISAILLLLGTFVFAATTPHAEVHLVSDTQTISPEQKFQVGLHFKLKKGWHIYWSNPGDSGEPPSVRWQLPQGMTVQNFQWPVPAPIPLGPLMNFGYEDEVLLIADAKAPQINSGPAVIKAHARWLICRETCIPEKAELELPLRLADKSVVSAQQKLFSKFNQLLPKESPEGWGAKVESIGEYFELHLRGSKVSEKNAFFFPSNPELIENASEQIFSKTPDGLKIKLKKAEGLSAIPATFDGVLKFGSQASYVVHAKVLANTVQERPAPAASAPSLFIMLFFAFIGGAILNLMPCVFPVLSIKILGFLNSTGKNRNVIIRHGLVYSAGIVVSFWILTAVLLVLRAGGSEVGWGFQLQSASFVAILSSVLFLMGLNLLGVFEFGAGLTGIGSRVASAETYTGSFLSGILATVVATPCTAPFMGTAAGFALTQSPFLSLLTFTSMALGLAAPFLAISFYPHLSRFLPRPGRWMETFKQLMSFPVFASVIWLVWIFALQAGINETARLLVCLLFLAIAAWTRGRWSQSRRALFAFLLLIGFGLFLVLPAKQMRSAVRGDTTSSQWQSYNPSKIQEYQNAGKIVFVDFTAAWCVTCQVNERVVLESEDVKKKFAALGVVQMKADWTNEDPVITPAITSFGRSGVPLYVIYAQYNQVAPRVLPELISKGIVLNELENLSKLH